MQIEITDSSKKDYDTTRIENHIKALEKINFISPSISHIEMMAKSKSLKKGGEKMKNFFIGLILIFALCLPAFAETKAIDFPGTIAALPTLNQVACYLSESNTVQYGFSFTVVALYNGIVNLDAGYIPASNETLAILGLKLFNIGTTLQIPILEYIDFQPFVAVGIKNLFNTDGQLSSEIIYGLKVIAINL